MVRSFIDNNEKQIKKRKYSIHPKKLSGCVVSKTIERKIGKEPNK